MTDTEGQCEAWRKIRASHKDTTPTIEQIQVHNATGRRLGCKDWETRQ